MSESPQAPRLAPNTPGVAHETVDDEVVIINLVSGDYYSCLGVAADAWRALAAGATPSEVADAISGAYEVGDADVDVCADLTTFAGALVDEQLLVPRGGDPEPLPTFGGGPYVAPVFEKFSDMADLIILDPVHDVSGQGWPHAPGPA